MYWNYDYNIKSEVLVGRPQKFMVTVARYWEQRIWLMHNLSENSDWHNLPLFQLKTKVVALLDVLYRKVFYLLFLIIVHSLSLYGMWSSQKTTNIRKLLTNSLKPLSSPGPLLTTAWTLENMADPLCLRPFWHCSLSTLLLVWAERDFKKKWVGRPKGHILRDYIEETYI